MSLPICKGKKKDGTQCASHTSYPNGYCLSHQSQAPVPAPAPASATTSTAPVAPATPQTPATTSTAPVAPATPQTPATTPPAPARSNNLPWIIGGIIVALILVLLACSGLTVFAANRGLFPVAPPAATPLPTPIPTDVPTLIPTLMPTPTLPPTVAPTQPPAAPQTAVNYPLAGQRYESPQGDSYSAVWTNDGRLWQPRLPTGAERIAHTVAITIEEGSYAFDGVECQLFVDSSRNGQGASNPVTAQYGNDLRFVVDTADGGQAWALVQCRGNASSGFQIRWLGPLP